MEQKHRERSRLRCELQICNKGQRNQRCIWMACKGCCAEKCANEKRFCSEHNKYEKLDICEVFVKKNGYPDTLWKNHAELAEGSFGVAHLGQWGLEQVVIKSFKRTGLDSDRQKCIESEVRVWSQLKSGHIVPLWATTGSEGNISALVTPLYWNGSFDDFLNGENQDANDLQLHLQLLFDIASGLYDMHRMGAYHGDITMRNLLVGHDRRAALTDFGLSRLSEQKGYSTNGAYGSPVYRAPECFEEGELSGDPKARASRDVWAFAIVIAEALTQPKTKPYDDQKEEAEVKNCLQNGWSPYRWEQIVDLPNGLREIVWMSWNTIPSERPEISQILEAILSSASALSISLAPAKAPETY